LSDCVADRSPAMCGSDTLATLVSSTSMKVAIVTVSAMTHGLNSGGAADRASGAGRTAVLISPIPFHRRGRRERGERRKKSRETERFLWTPLLSSLCALCDLCGEMLFPEPLYFVACASRSPAWLPVGGVEMSTSGVTDNPTNSGVSRGFGSVSS